MERVSLAWWTVFGTAFGLNEAVLVAYVRKMLKMAHGLDYAEIWTKRGLVLNSRSFSDEFLRQNLLGQEIFREIATIFLLVGAAMAAGRTWRERWGIFLWTFAVWDLTYYVFLVPLTGFPRSLAATDVYFLVPITWYGPVWFPVCVVMPTLLLLAARLLKRETNKKSEL